jgi:hypothetical protein
MGRGKGGLGLGKQAKPLTAVTASAPADPSALTLFTQPQPDFALPDEHDSVEGSKRSEGVSKLMTLKPYQPVDAAQEARLELFRSAEPIHFGAPPPAPPVSTAPAPAPAPALATGDCGFSTCTCNGGSYFTCHIGMSKVKVKVIDKVIEKVIDKEQPQPQQPTRKLYRALCTRVFGNKWWESPDKNAHIKTAKAMLTAADMSVDAAAARWNCANANENKRKREEEQQEQPAAAFKAKPDYYTLDDGTIDGLRVKQRPDLLPAALKPTAGHFFGHSADEIVHAMGEYAQMFGVELVLEDIKPWMLDKYKQCEVVEPHMGDDHPNCGGLGSIVVTAIKQKIKLKQREARQRAMPKPVAEYFAGRSARYIEENMDEWAESYGVEIDKDTLSGMMFECHGEEADGCYPPSSGSDSQGDGQNQMAECVTTCLVDAIQRKEEYAQEAREVAAERAARA